MDEKALDKFTSLYGSNYTFDSEYDSMFEFIIEKRFINEWWKESYPAQQLRVLQVLRILTRDNRMQKKFLQGNAINFLILLMQNFAQELFSFDRIGVLDQTFIQILVEVTNIIKRFTIVPKDIEEIELFENACLLVLSNGLKYLVLLLSCSEPLILRTVLVSLQNLCLHNNFFEYAVSFSMMEPLLFIFTEEDIILQVHAGTVIQLLLANPIFKSDAIQMKALSSCVRNLHGEIALISLQIMCSLFSPNESDSPNLSPAILPSPLRDSVEFKSNSNYISCSSEIRLSGGIPVVLSLINRDSGEVLAEVAVSVCTLVVHLSLDDENAVEIRKKHGVHLLGDLLMQTYSKKSGSEDYSADSLHQLQLHIFRALRFLFSVERNRKVFKHLFSPEIFSAFIDIGHYCYDLSSYESLLPLFYSISDSTYQSMIAEFDELKCSFQNRKKVGDYYIEEIIGKGAFGTVYQVCSVNEEKRFAMKQLPIVQVNSNSDGLKATELKEVCKEVEIISHLDHPNIVKYYNSFEFENELYIIMELVDGVSLADHLTSLSEKDFRFREERIWPIFIQICLALSYLHLEQRIVHRDLTPNNILLDAQGRVKIADFGLASQRVSHATLLQSVVGTISYSCPEIVQHQPYTDKADIWSLGCVLYQMATLSPPFAGGNPLTVAHKIVTGEYPPLENSTSNHYSGLLRQVVKRLLSACPDDRPDIVQTSQMISPLLMTELDRMNASLIKSEQSLLKIKNSKQESFKEKRFFVENVLEKNTKSNGIKIDSFLPTSRMHSIAVASKKLKSIKDPVEQLLLQFHKVMYASELQPVIVRPVTVKGTKREDDKEKHSILRTHILRYKRYLLDLPSRKQNIEKIGFTTLKEEMKKLLTSSSELISKEIFHNEVSSNVSYDQLHAYIEQVLKETNYYVQFSHLFQVEDCYDSDIVSSRPASESDPLSDPHGILLRANSLLRHREAPSATNGRTSATGKRVLSAQPLRQSTPLVSSKK